MRVNLVFLFSTLLGFLLLGEKITPHYYSLSETVDDGFDCNGGVRRWNNSSNNNKKMQHIYFPCSYSPRYIAANIPLNMLNHHSKTTQVKMNLPHFLDFICCSHFLRRQLSQHYVQQTRNKFAALTVSFKRIWHNISNVYLPTCDLFGMNDTNICHGGRSKRVSKTALPRLRLPLPLSHSSLSGKTTVWLLQLNWPISIF